MLIKLLLLFSLFLLFYLLIVGEFPVNLEALLKSDLPKQKTFKDKFQVYVLPLISATIFFFFGRVVFLSVLSGLIFAFLGWHLPKWVLKWREHKKKEKPRELAKDFITSAAGMYGAGQLTTDVIRHSALRMPAPFNQDFQEMLARRNLDGAPFHVMLRQMGNKYGLKEFDAAAAIIEASEKAGGPTAAAKGLKRLGVALRKREKQLMERRKANMEPQIACLLAIVILSLGLIMDATVFRAEYREVPIIMASGCLIVVGLIFAVVKISSNADLES
ncbi:type II secretion system F family protein [Peptococcaceae bacterium 1198_IL3148]